MVLANALSSAVSLGGGMSTGSSASRSTVNGAGH